LPEHTTISPDVQNSSFLNENITKEPHQKNNSDFLHPLSIQCKLSVSAVDDPLEDEADAMADKVMRMPEQNFVQRKCAHCEEEERAQRKPIESFIQKKCAACEEEEKAQRKPLASFIQKKQSSFNNNVVASDNVSNQIQSTKGSGNPMPDATKNFMESRFGANFSNVKIHTGNYAVQLSGDLNAQAFTVGNSIYFNEGKYQPESFEGKKLLAHELTHTIQQGNGVHRQIQRLGPPFGPAVNGPANWASQVSGATTSAQKTTLVQTAAGSAVTVNDATAASASDPVPDPAHLRAFTIASPVINFDQNLATKSARAGGRPLNINAGYTFQHGTAIYVVISDLALDGGSYNQTVQTINHEFDHVNQYLRHSTLTGNESELDAWTSTFIREFHHSYQFRPTANATTCYVELNSAFAPLLMYYQLVTNASQRTNAISRISAYYTAIISSNVANTHAFRFWVFRSMGSSHNPDLGTDINTALHLNITASGSATPYRSIPCSSVPAASLPGGSSLIMPTAPPTTSTTTTSTTSHP